MRYGDRLLSYVVVFVFLFQLFLPSSAFSVDYCDPTLVQVPRDPLGYQIREDRCEGQYLQEAAGTDAILILASLTEVFEAYDLTDDDILNVEWTAPEEQNIQLRAQGLRPRLLYRMDTLRPPVPPSYQWPLDMLKALDISQEEIGVVGWMRYPLNGGSKDVYLPLRIYQQQERNRSQEYRLVLWPGRELTEVFVSLATIQPDGSPKSFLEGWDGKMLKYGYYPAERGIEFTIPKPQEPGVYYLEVGATLRSGGVITLEHWMFHAE
jgi:hypothetical protein